MPRSSFSPGQRKDPAKAGPVIRKYERIMLRLFYAYIADARDTVSRRFGVRLNIRQDLKEIGLPYNNLALDKIQGAELKNILQALAGSYAKDLQEVASSGTKEAYDQGVEFGVKFLKKEGVKGVTTTYLPADWRALDWLTSRNLTALEGVTSEINDTIVREVSSGLLKGEGIRTVADRLGDLTGLADDRAYKIARYETMLALNQGTLLSYYQSGVEEVEWITGGDDGHTCDECLELDGQTFPIDKVPDCPLHVNCRCTLAPVVIRSLLNARAVTPATNIGESLMVALQARSAMPLAYLHLGGCPCAVCAGGAV